MIFFILMWLVVRGLDMVEECRRMAINVMLKVVLNEVVKGREVEVRTAEMECF